MPRRYGLVGGARRARKSIAGAITAGVGAAVALAQATDADGGTITIGALVIGFVNGVVVYWTSNAEEE